jgi:hypothetical protein
MERNTVARKRFPVIFLKAPLRATLRRKIFLIEKS